MFNVHIALQVNFFFNFLENVQLSQRIKQSEEQSSNLNNFYMEITTKQRKFDFIAKYMGKGIFKMDN